MTTGAVGDDELLPRAESTASLGRGARNPVFIQLEKKPNTKKGGPKAALSV